MEDTEDASKAVREIVARLNAQLPDQETLLSLLSAPLASLKILPSEFHQYNKHPIPTITSLKLDRILPRLQQAVLEHVIPTWEARLNEENLEPLLENYFCPSNSGHANSRRLALHAYTTILSNSIGPFSVRMLDRLSQTYSIDSLFISIFRDDWRQESTPPEGQWDDCIRLISAIPGKVANAALAGNFRIPLNLENGAYFNYVSLRVESLVRTEGPRLSEVDISSLSQLLLKLVNIGVFPASSPISPAQPSFFGTVLPTLRSQFTSLNPPQQPTSTNQWPALFSTLPLSSQQIVLGSLLAALGKPKGLSPSTEDRQIVKREALLLQAVFGPLRAADDEERWEVIAAVTLSRIEDEGLGRIILCWIAGCGKEEVQEDALQLLLWRIVDVWTSSEHIKHSLLSKHHYMTSLFLVAISYLGGSSDAFRLLSTSPAFISSIGTYIGHLDRSVRRCGMLVAEVVAQKSGRTLSFGGWEGTGEGREWSRVVRELILAKDAEVELQEAAASEESTQSSTSNPIATPAPQQGRQQPTQVVMYDSDDSLTGYASPSSSRSPSPTPSELDEIEKDPTLRNPTRKKITRPVYLVDLGVMLRNTKSEEEEAETIKVALSCAAELIRRKKGYGLELEENAVNLTYGLIALHNNYELSQFDEQRQAALNALVACCPQKAAPTIIEQFFNNQYSTEQRFVMLNALVIGARELAGLPVPPSAAPKTAFPSRMLPPAMHRKYITDGDTRGLGSEVQRLMDGISQKAIDSGREQTASKVPELVRERQLRIRKTRIAEVNSNGSDIRPSSSAFKDIAAEYFLGPLFGRFWLYLRDEQTREERTASSRSAYRGTGTGMILNALVLSQLLSTIGVLMHAARHSPAYLAVLAPDALEIAITVGTRGPSAAKGGEVDAKQAAVLAASLELALVVLDTCLELDGGRSLGLEQTTLLLGVGEWSSEVFKAVDRGARLEGSGGEDESRVRRAAAGVVIKIEEVTSRWRRSMVSM